MSRRKQKVNSRMIIIIPIIFCLYITCWVVVLSLTTTTLAGEGLADGLNPIPEPCSLLSVWCLNEPNDNHLPVNKLTDNPIQIIAYLSSKAGLNVNSMIKLAMCESFLNPKIRGFKDKRDRGLWQINSYYHPDVTDEIAFDPWLSTQWAVDKIKAGGAGIWVCQKRLNLKF